MDPAERAQAARARVPRIDPYGFERPEDFDYAAYEEFFSTYLVILTKRAIKWSKLLKGSGGVRKSVTVKRYVRKGIPLEHRARVWMAVSGAQAQMDQNPGYYHRLLEGESSSRLEEAIRTGGRPAFTALSHVARAGRAEQGPSGKKLTLAQVVGNDGVCLTEDVPTNAKFWGEVKTKVFTKRTAATTSS